MKEKIITIKVNGASQGQWSNLLLELNLIRKAWKTLWCRYILESTWYKICN